MAMPRLAGGTFATSLPSMMIEPDVASSRPGDDAQQRRFSAAGRSDENDEFAVLDLEIDALQHIDRPKDLRMDLS